jgi:F0F1-type ATP synthase assembly protein I
MARRAEDNVWVQISKYMSLAFMLPISTVVGYGIGWLLDKLFHTHFLYLVFLVFGIVAGFIEVFRGIAAETGRDGN